MFRGFTPETIDFLWGIRMNNNREWFLEHKQQYTTQLCEPMKELGEDLYQILSERTGDYLKISRIYKDARMHHAEPYKESLWLSIRRDHEYWAQSPCLFFEIRPDCVSYGFSLWKPRSADMGVFRSRIAASPDSYLAMIQKTESAIGLPVTAVCYKRPKGQSELPALQPYFSWKEDIACIVHEEIGEPVFSSDLGVRVCNTLKDLLPLYDFFNLICSADSVRQ